MNIIKKEIAELLESEAQRINSPAFIGDDPVQFPRRFEKKQDIEIVAVLSAIMAWGNRKMICRDIENTLQMMDFNPSDFIREEAYEAMNPHKNIHRTLFASDLNHLLRGLRYIFKTYGSLDDFCTAVNAPQNPYPAWCLVENMQKVMTDVNHGTTNSRALPLNMNTTALKRINMALRWLVRDDGIVDIGIWDSLKKSQLFIPLDVHVGNVSRELGLLNRKANDKKSVIELTQTLARLRPDDPCIYDYALFGIGAGI
ncbi:MAG: TIGR02757 family protein [Prevotella sp.]|nr:TIGR02757 family protein [Bacteroides sp.]MCM1366737.1 TIGR02757 family protein [Prevotella sp.]MCM1437025.1 TIGR02757 family protein [Prevotella sp.]